MKKPVEQRFWEKVEKTETCWLWRAGRQGWGYGQFSYKSYPNPAHRVAWILTRGEIPKGLVVCHTCDNRLCVNPEHLFLGTYEENNLDKMRKGRARGPLRFTPYRSMQRKIGRGAPRRDANDRFWAKVEKTLTCWVWTASGMHDGRGVFHADPRSRRNVSAPRYSWEIHHGGIPEGMWVLHRCDNPRCVRPEHLFLGTASDNNLDSLRKGRRQMPPVFRGAENSKTKLTEDAVRAIRAASAETAGSLALAHGVSIGAIQHIRKGRSWKHLP
jgi:hypothetical protein